DAAVLRSIASLERVNGKPVDQFWKDADARRAEFADWVRRVATLPPDQQVKEVAARLKERNPGSPCYMTSQTMKGVVTEIWIHEAHHLTDLSPVRALAGLRSLKTDAGAGGHLTDLAPLRAMSHLARIDL